MRESPETLLVGVDGGGTSCRVGLITSGNRFEAERGSANVSTDPDRAIANILSGIEQVFSHAGIADPARSTCVAYLGLAGIVDESDTRKVVQALPFRNVTVADDRHTAIAGALGDTDGAVAGLGTGSYLARQADGVYSEIGGWGFPLGDEASGAGLGRRLLAATLHAEDGLAEHSDLTRAMPARFGGASGIVSMSLRAPHRDYAKLAPAILDAARADDAVALQLIGEGIAYVSRGLAALGWSRGERLCLIGGVGPHYLPFLPEDLAASVTPPDGTALDGALALAAKQAAKENAS